MDLVGSRVEVLVLFGNEKVGRWLSGTVDCFRVKLGRHLIVFDDGYASSFEVAKGLVSLKTVLVCPSRRTKHGVKVQSWGRVFSFERTMCCHSCVVSRLRPDCASVPSDRWAVWLDNVVEGVEKGRWVRYCKTGGELVCVCRTFGGEVVVCPGCKVGYHPGCCTFKNRCPFCEINSCTWKEKGCRWYYCPTAGEWLYCITNMRHVLGLVLFDLLEMDSSCGRLDCHVKENLLLGNRGSIECPFSTISMLLNSEEKVKENRTLESFMRGYLDDPSKVVRENKVRVHSPRGGFMCFQGGFSEGVLSACISEDGTHIQKRPGSKGTPSLTCARVRPRPRLVKKKRTVLESNHVKNKKQRQHQQVQRQEQHLSTLALGREKRLRFGRSRIHAWGVFAEEPLAANDFVIEYKGELIRAVISDLREKYYAEQGIPDYMFRIDDEFICDATQKGSLARFINHSCDPNCFTSIISHQGVKKIVIYAKQAIDPGEELCYDYKFSIEDDPSLKIPCTCGATNCRRFMN